MGLTPELQVGRLLERASAVERAFADSDITLHELRLELGSGERARRVNGRIDGGRKV